jgi:hypothetical protein
VRVRIDEKDTPVVLESRGPEASESDIARFESQLGYKLPLDYREFLLRYNGGDPVVGVVNGRDDDPDVPYQSGDAVRYFFKLPTAAGDVDEYERLLPPAEIPSELPRDVLPIAEDSGGNLFILELGKGAGRIRFWDHESFDEPLEQHRILADSFGDFLTRFRSVEEQEAIDKAEKKAERQALETGDFPAKLAALCNAVEHIQPDVPVWIRKVCLKIFEEKGYFAVHGDELSRTLLDLAFWLNQSARTERRPTKRTEMATIIRLWHREDNDAFGLNGYAPAFLTEWWEDRLAKGMLDGTTDNARFTEQASNVLLQKIREMQ